MKKNFVILGGLSLSLLLCGCGVKEGANPVLPILLGVLGVVALFLGVLQVLSYTRYVRYARRKKRPVQKMGLWTYVFCGVGVVLLVVALLTGCDTNSAGVSNPSTGEVIPDPTETTTVQAGWIENESGSRSYRNEDGTLTVGWLDQDNKRYYLDENGCTLSGWAEVEGMQRYFREDGSMARGEEVIDGQKRFFTSTGAEVLLVNPWNAVPEGYTVETMKPGPSYTTEGIEINAEIYEPLKEMMDDCNVAMAEQYGSKASRCCVTSGYRDMAYQQRLFDNKVKSYLSQGMTQEEAEAKAATSVAIPGTSEHQLGLAVDLVDTQSWSLDEFQEDLPAQVWLMENSWRYGFILRYPNGKTEVTGIIYEPWHYRYLGIELAAEIHESGLTLEEYLDNLD